MARKKQHPPGEPTIPEAARPAYEAIAGLIDAFCREHLDEEYRVLCRKLAGILARKRPSPLTRGKPESWASGIVRVVGWANFLGDPSQPHHMKMTDIDRAFGVSEATGSAKSMAIRDLLGIDRLSPEWTLPSRMEDNPLVWMLKVNGLITDIRLCPREAQVVAFENGLIPYIPADRESGAAEECPMARKKSESVPCRFQPGDEVRVKHGVRDPDFPDIPLGGWAGAIKEVHQAEGETTFLVSWDRATLKGMHSIYRKRCERDGLELESMWLGEDDLEPDDGTPVPIEQPTTIVTKPLSEKDQDDRVRMALGLTHDDPLPDVGRKTLLAYHRYLAARLKFPFKAKAGRDGMPLTIQRLVDPKDCDLDDEGLLCEARSREGPFDLPLSELEGGGENRKLVEDYCYWFHNWR